MRNPCLIDAPGTRPVEIQFLQRHYVGSGRLDHSGNARRRHLLIRASAAMHIVC